VCFLRAGVFWTTSFLQVSSSFLRAHQTYQRAANVRRRAGESSPAMSPAGARLTIDGMVCGACTSAVTSALQKVGGVRSVSVSLETKSATVRYDSGATGLDSLRTAVETCGFDVLSVVPTDADPSPVPTRLVTLAIGGMTCARCSDWVTRALEDLQGVQQVSVDLKTHKALVRCAVGGASLVRCVAGTGYTARLLRVDDVAEDEVQNTTTGSYVQQQNTTVPYVTDEGFDDSEALFSGTETSFSDAAASSSSRDGAGASNVITLRVSGMSCASCASKVEEAALSCPGVVSATVNLLAETATVTLSLGDAPGESGHQNKRRNNNTTTHWATPDPETVARFVTNYGFPSEVVDATGLAFRVGGMVCASCPPRIEMALGRLKGVTKVEANELLGKVLVKYNAAQIGARTLMRAIEKLEYAPVELWEDDSALTGTSTGHQKEAARYKKEFLLSCVFAVPLFLLMMVLDKIEVFHAALMTDCLGGAAAPGMLPVMSLLSFFLATPVQFGLGKQFYVRAYRAVKHGGANMDLLVALGTSAAYAYSTYVVLAGIAAPALVKGSAQFYETSAVLIAFVLMGKWLEARAKGATSNAIRVLVALQPTTARIVEMPGDGSVASHLADVAAKRAKELTSKGSVTSDDFEDFEETHDAFVELATAAATAAAVSSGAGERQVDTALLQRGDVLRVTPGGRFPADGLVISGHTSADESALTGESMPVTKIPGQFVIGGTINAGGGSPLVLATNVGADAMLAKVVRLIEDAQVAKAPIQAYADKGTCCISQIPTLFSHTRLTLFFPNQSERRVRAVRGVRRHGDLDFLVCLREKRVRSG
jgi:Cu+-exporting ATPase